MRAVGPKKARLILCLVLAGAGCRTGGGVASPPAPPPSPWALEDEAPGPLLWEVQGKSGSVYLFGTVHVLGADDVPPLALEKFTAARALVLETDTKAMSPIKALAYAMLPWKQSLDQILGPRLWAQLVAALGPTIPEAALRRFKPWMAGTLLLASLVPMPKQGMDIWLQEQATQQKKELVFLESIDEQLAALEQAMDVSMLEAMLKDLPAQRDVVQGIITAYRKGDVRMVETLLALSESSTPRAMEALLDQRNRRWLPAIEALAANQGGFVAVGAGHLGGVNGLVALLRARGQTVRRAPGRIARPDRSPPSPSIR